MKSQLPCPDCRTSISFDVSMLLSGTAFSCPCCELSFSLDPSSKPQLSKAVEGFAELKRLNHEAKHSSASVMGG
ncbi:hypothetical protein L4D06_03125 [Enterovibrio makurazakiensis]|uniref:Transcription factor zinc-finger domain-containing protein n=1 Tax=Enterovibrio gelatinilyticus TaxID=2899819 RepID=A0ABT5R2M9_9GAMM|nr:hypothetical protein [Enterovibrio sp. ZSDZ42]MDD1794533.1 hypothetical protein [Enterovibrio sp. ZSDZ42]